VLLEYVNTAAAGYHKALELLLENAVNDLAVMHNQLDNIYGDAGDMDRSLRHHREAIRYDEAGQNFYAAGQHRYNVAVTLIRQGGLADARDYVAAALRNFEQFGPAAAAEIEETQRLLGQIEAALNQAA